jgi:hypothetical protein
MASSETLGPSHRFMSYYDGSLPNDLVWAGIKRLPNLLHVPFPSVLPFLPRWTKGLHMTVPSPFTLAFAIPVRARHPQPHTRRFSCGKRNEAAKFASCYGPEGLLALHRQGHVYFQASLSPFWRLQHNLKLKPGRVPLTFLTNFDHLFLAR